MSVSKPPSRSPRSQLATPIPPRQRNRGDSVPSKTAGPGLRQGRDTLNSRSSHMITLEHFICRLWHYLEQRGNDGFYCVLVSEGANGEVTPYVVDKKGATFGKRKPTARSTKHANDVPYHYLNDRKVSNEHFKVPRSPQ
jgi:hypothetical protein